MIRMIERIAASAIVAAVSSLACTSPVRAIDVEANDYVDAPDGTNVVLGYYSFSHANAYNSTTAGTYTRQTHLDENLGIFRYVYYNSVFGVHYVAQFLIPVASLNNVDIGGAHLNNTFGAADPILSVGVWGISNVAAKQYLTLFSYTSLPIGSYSSSRALSIGTNSWAEDIQANYTQRLYKGLGIDIDLDYIYTGDNTDANVLGQTLKQKSSYQVETWLNYDITPTSFFAVGWLGEFGGTQTINGIPNGSKTEYQQIRGEYAFRPTPTIQLLAKVYHDINVVGGFKDDIGFTLRFVKAF
ncbi:transporter [Lichenicoccus roseus]|uniref:Transporter n=1 Tax=Lichenicoccus roseus TaxID=2683649 RepID=A0A5R9J3E9_9PROT|nr:transporter [Lichenicoccus roseus]TLU72150.1 transporter [Lichenicoccus roseus]